MSRNFRFVRGVLCSRKFSNIIPFKLADIGEGIAEVELLKWFVKSGDKIRAFDRLCEVQSDKATVEITSRYDGEIITVHYEEGAIVKVGAALVDIQSEGPPNGSVTSTILHNPPTESCGTMNEHTEQKHLAQSDNVCDPTESQYYFDNNSKVLTTPAVRKLAKERNINLAEVSGSGPKGRILKEDILSMNKFSPYNQSKSALSASTINTPLSSTSSPPYQSYTPAPMRIIQFNQREDQKVPIRGIQRLMVNSMTAANQVQHLTFCEEIIFDQLIKLRLKLNNNLKRNGKLHNNTINISKLSYMPLLIKLTSVALTQFPMLNATVSVDTTFMTYHGDHNIGVAMDTKKGLVVPVVKHVQQKSILDIAQELHHLQESAAAGTLTENEMKGGTFSLSNIGSIGGTYAVPVLVVPQVAIGAIGRVQTVPRYVTLDGELASTDDIYSGAARVEPKSILTVSWSADHRVVDGATIARFSNLWKSYVESPLTMMSELK